MSNQLTAEDMMVKAETACSSARLLLDHGDTNGAINRAYYAMFDAARSALLRSGAPVDPNIIRTHNGLIGAFGQYVVKNNPELSTMGRTLNDTQESRIMADYKRPALNRAVAEDIVELAETFIATIKALQFDRQPELPGRDSPSDSSPSPF